MNMIITKEHIDNGMSANGGWSMEQLKCFNINHFYKGWQKDVIGKDFDIKIYYRFINLKNSHVKNFNENQTQLF
jgi:hypothetical protein